MGAAYILRAVHATGDGDRIRLREGAVHWRRVEGRIVAIDVPSREYLALNATGSCLWPALAEGATVPALVDILVERFEVEEARAAEDIGALLDDLRGRGLLEE
jgi:Coenzyme PQQ synthesis protein D (PqqD)